MLNGQNNGNGSATGNRSKTWMFGALAGLLVSGVIVGTALSADGVVKAVFDRVVIDNPVPPAIAVPKDGFAIIGAADSRYYIVTPDGAVNELRANRRDLYWRTDR